MQVNKKAISGWKLKLKRLDKGSLLCRGHKEYAEKESLT